MDDNDMAEDNNQPAVPNNFQVLELINAIKFGALTLVQEFLTHNELDINAPIDGGWTPFMIACFYSKFDIMVHLLNLGANATDSVNFFTPLMATCSRADSDETSVLQCVKFLINQGIPINERDSQGTTALMMAAKNGHNSVVLELIARKSSIDMQDSEGWTALFHAVLHNQVEVTKTLLDNGAATDLVDRRGRKVIDFAEIKNLTNILDLLPKAEQRDRATLREIPIAITPQKFEDLILALPANENFMADVVHFLRNLDLDRYSYSFYSKRVSLKSFLKSNEKELMEVGVYLSHHRKLILNSIRKFHLCKWSKDCLGYTSQGRVKSDQIAYFLANITRHLYTLTGSLAYIQKTRGNKSKVEETNNLLLKNIDQLNILETRLKRIKFYGEYLDKNDKIIHVDLLTDKTTLGTNNFLKHVYYFYIPFTILSFIAVRNKNLITEVFTSFSKKLFS